MNIYLSLERLLILLLDTDTNVFLQSVAWLCSLTGFRTLPAFSTNQTFMCERGNKRDVLQKVHTNSHIFTECLVFSFLIRFTSQ